MGVRIDGVRHVVIDHVRYPGNVQAAGSDVGRHEDTVLAGAEAAVGIDFQLQASTPDGQVTTNSAGNTQLAAWLNAQYNNGSGAGRWVFLRLSTDAVPSGTFRYTVSSADNTTPENRPRIRYNFTSEPETLYTRIGTDPTFQQLIDNGVIVYAGVDYAAILRHAEREADIIVWDGGNNDTSFYRPDLTITVVDPHRPGHERTYYPGAANVRLADVIVINKVDSAPEENIEAVHKEAMRVNPKAIIVRAASPITAVSWVTPTAMGPRTCGGRSRRPCCSRTSNSEPAPAAPPPCRRRRRRRLLDNFGVAANRLFMIVHRHIIEFLVRGRGFCSFAAAIEKLNSPRFDLNDVAGGAVFILPDAALQLAVH